MVFAKKNFHRIERVYPLAPSLICFFSINGYRESDFSEDFFPGYGWVFLPQESKLTPLFVLTYF